MPKVIIHRGEQFVELDTIEIHGSHEHVEELIDEAFECKYGINREDIVDIEEVCDPETYTYER